MNKQTVKRAANKIGATLTETRYVSMSDHWEFEVESPDGKIFESSDSQTMVVMWHSYINGDKEGAFKDVVERISFGTREKDYE